MPHLSATLNIQQPSVSPLEITNVMPWDKIDIHTCVPAGCFRVIANQPLWQVVGQRVTSAGLLLERAVTATPEEEKMDDAEIHSFTVHTAPNTPSRTTHGMWIQHPNPRMLDPKTVTEDFLNERIRASFHVKPALKVFQKHEGLLLAHRSVRYGQLLLDEIKRLPSLQSAEVIPTGTKLGSGPYVAYPEGVLLGAVTHPSAAAFESTSNDIRRLAEKEIVTAEPPRPSQD